MIEQKYISVSEAASRLGLRYGQVIRLIRAHKLKAEKPGKTWSWLIDQDSVEEYKKKAAR